MLGIAIAPWVFASASAYEGLGIYRFLLTCDADTAASIIILLVSLMRLPASPMNAFLFRQFAHEHPSFLLVR